MEKSQARIHFLLAFLGFLAMGGMLAYLLLAKQEASVNSNIFQHKYLSGIQHAIDLGKNLNSYSDFLYQEIKSPRGRDSSIFAAKAQSSLKLFMDKNILSQDKRRETEQALQSLLKKSNLIMSHLEEGDAEVARKIYEKEYLEELKGFHMGLDSHKKYIQNEAARFYSRNLSGNDLFSGGILAVAGSVAFFCALSFALLWLKWKSSVNRAMAERRGLVSRLDALAEGGFKVNQIFEHIRSNCQLALGEREDLSASFAPLKSQMPATEGLSKQLDKFFQHESSWIREHEQRLCELEKLLKGRERVWEEARMKLKAFSKVKIELLNSGLGETGSFEFGPELLAMLEDLEDVFTETPFEPKAWKDLRDSVRAWEAKSLQSQEDIGEALQSWEADCESARFEAAKAYRDWNRTFEEKIKAAERCLAAKNELLTAILVLTDPHELPEDLEADQASASKAA